MRNMQIEKRILIKSFFRGVFVAWAVSIFGLAISCVPQSKSPVKIKVLSLNPDGYIGAKLHLSGKVTGIGPADSYLMVEDDTGRIMVGTEQIASKIGCDPQAKVELVGTLRRLKSLPQPYFSMEKLLSCQP